MMHQISSGEPFDCVYLKSDGTLTEFKQLRKPVAEESKNTPPDKRRSKRTLQGYLMLIPFQTITEEVRELYTRLIVIFNNEEVIL